MEKYYPYACKRCGRCCRRVDLVDELAYLDRGDGVCKNLTDENLCRIYAERPPLCNGKYLYENFFPNMTVAEFHEMIAALCKEIAKVIN